MEGSKRVKDQILKIDTTLPPVDFSYTKQSGEKVEVKTLEQLQYSNLYKVSPDSEAEEEVEKPIIETIEEPMTEQKEQPKEDFKEKHFVFEENQIGVSYEKLFAPIFKGAKRIEIIK